MCVKYIVEILHGRLQYKHQNYRIIGGAQEHSLLPVPAP